MTENSLNFKLFLLFTTLLITFVTSDKCNSRPFSKLQASFKLTKDSLTISKDKITEVFGEFKSGNPKSLEEYKRCMEACPGIIIYTDSCATYNFDDWLDTRFYTILNARLKDTTEENLKKLEALYAIQNNMAECLEPSHSLDLLTKLSFNSFTYRISFLNIEPNTEVKEKDYFVNKSFLSTTTIFKSLQPYMKEGKHLLVFSPGIVQAGNADIKGKLIKACSMVPEDEEFLISRGQCWEVEHVMDYDERHNNCGQIELLQASVEISKAIEEKKEPLEFDFVTCKNVKKGGEIKLEGDQKSGDKEGEEKLVENRVRRGRILEKIQIDQKVDQNYDHTGRFLAKTEPKKPEPIKTGNKPESFKGKRIFLRPMDCASTKDKKMVGYL